MDMYCKYYTNFSDYSKGFGGKYGVEADKVDKSAVGWDHHEKAAKHPSQKGQSSCQCLLDQHYLLKPFLVCV